jgi:hypothetical protein
MKTARDACVLQDNALEIKVIDQIEKLDKLIEEEGDGSEFFERNHFTQGMKDLVREGTARLAGKSTQAIFHLKQSMGGGKTHLMLGFGLLAKSKELRNRICPEVGYINDFDSVKIAAFNGYNDPQNYFWGEIAQQLGKEELFRENWINGPKGPDKEAWINLFDGGQPILILLDEMPVYFENLRTRTSGAGTIADVAKYAFTTMLVAASEKSNVCILVSDLNASAWRAGSSLIDAALNDARQQIGRMEKPIIPVDLTGNEIYEILKKRLFKQLPDNNVINEIAAAYGTALEDASRAKAAGRGAEAIADDISSSYPFHPKLKELISLFKENESFRQTRGLMELVSRLLKSVWERPDNDVFLIGAQHFDLSIQEVRDKIVEISGMEAVINTDIYNQNQSSWAQKIDLNNSNRRVSEISVLLLTSSLSTAVRPIRGLTEEELVECLITPFNQPSEYKEPFKQLVKEAWYLHHTPEGKYFFDKQENLTKMLKSLAQDAPEEQIDELIKNRLQELYEPKRKIAYHSVLPLPSINEINDAVRLDRTLVVFDPDSKIPPEQISKYFKEDLVQKNNLLVLTGDRTQMTNIRDKARLLFAAQKADNRIPKGHQQREELESKQLQYDQDLNTIIFSVFDKILFPFQASGYEPSLESKPLDMTRDQNLPYNGEQQIEKTLSSPPQKLFLDVNDETIDNLRTKAEMLLWRNDSNEISMSDLRDRLSEQAGMPWLGQREFSQLMAIAQQRGWWEDLGNGYITKQPKKKKTGLQYQKGKFNEHGVATITSIQAINGGPTPKIYYAENDQVSQNSNLLTDDKLETTALRVNFLVIDPSQQYETGDVITVENTPTIINISFDDVNRTVELLLNPQGELRFTLDNTEPRNGQAYQEPIQITDDAATILTFADCQGVEVREKFEFPAKDRPITIPPGEALYKPEMPLEISTKSTVFEIIDLIKSRNMLLYGVTLNVSHGDKQVRLTIADTWETTADYLQSLIGVISSTFDPAADITLKITRVKAAHGQDLEEMIAIAGNVIKAGTITSL